MSEGPLGEFLYEGESVLDTFDVGETRVVLTSHRVAVAKPGSRAVEQVERSSLEGIERDTTGSRSLLWSAFIFGVVGIPVFALGLIVDIDDLADFEEAREEDTGGVLGDGGSTILDWTLAAAANLDAVLLYGGAIIIGFAVLFVVIYWLVVRTPTVALRVAGDQPDIHIPRSGVAPAVMTRLDAAIQGGGRQDVSDGMSAERVDTGADNRQLQAGEAPKLTAGAIRELPATDVEARPVEEGDTSASDER